MIRRPPRSTQSRSSAASDVYKRQIETRVLHEFDACVRSNEKHNIVVSIKEDWEARGLLKMAEALAGGKEELKRRPMFTAIICTVSPLHQERFGMDLALVLAEVRHPRELLPHADPRRDWAGDDRRLGRGQQRRVPQRRHAGPAGSPRRQGDPCLLYTS